MLSLLKRKEEDLKKKNKISNPFSFLFIQLLDWSWRKKHIQLLNIYGGKDMSNSWTFMEEKIYPTLRHLWRRRERESYIQLLDKEGERKIDLNNQPLVVIKKGCFQRPHASSFCTPSFSSFFFFHTIKLLKFIVCS